MVSFLDFCSVLKEQGSVAQQRAERALEIIKMLPSERFELVFDKIKKCAKFCGIYTLAKKFSPNYFAMSNVAFLLATYFGLAGFTVSTADSEDLSTIMEHIAIALIMTQGLMKLFNALKNGKRIYEMNRYILEIIKENEKLEGQLQMLTYKCVRTMEVLFKVAVVLYSSTFLTLGVTPTVILVATGKQVLLASYSLPFLSPTFEFFFTYIIQLVQQCVFVSGLLAVDSLLALQIVHIIMLVDIFKLKLSAIDRELVKKGKTSNLITKMLVDTIRWHQGFCRYTKLLKECFNLHVSAHVATCTVMISVTVFTLLISGWPGSYPLLVFFYVTLFAFCILGTVYETQQETLSEAIYNFKWYLLNVREQKMVLFMLARSQQPTVLDIFGITPFNVRTAVAVTQTIYSYIMMMASFME